MPYDTDKFDVRFSQEQREVLMVALQALIRGMAVRPATEKQMEEAELLHAMLADGLDAIVKEAPHSSDNILNDFTA